MHSTTQNKTTRDGCCKFNKSNAKITIELTSCKKKLVGYDTVTVPSNITHVSGMFLSVTLFYHRWNVSCMQTVLFQAELNSTSA